MASLLMCELAHSVEEQQAARAYTHARISQMSNADIQAMKALAKEQKAARRGYRRGCRFAPQQCTEAAEETEQPKKKGQRKRLQKKPKVDKIVEVVEPLDEVAPELSAGREAWAPIDILQLVHKCADGQGVNRATSWADAAESDGDSSEDEAWNKETAANSSKEV